MNPRERAVEMGRLNRLASLLDDQFAIPGTSIRFGLDGLLGLIPVIGDFATFLLSLYIVIRAHRLGAPGTLLGRMAANAIIDWLIGSIPVLGDFFDVGFKANRRNVDLLRHYLHETYAQPPAA
ncbi:MAG: DUF4112 domain-containing protein [Alphaproteobacteria bacterium]